MRIIRLKYTRRPWPMAKVIHASFYEVIAGPNSFGWHLPTKGHDVVEISLWHFGIALDGSHCVWTLFEFTNHLDSNRTKLTRAHCGRPNLNPGFGWQIPLTYIKWSPSLVTQLSVINESPFPLQLLFVLRPVYYSHNGPATLLWVGISDQG